MLEKPDPPLLYEMGPDELTTSARFGRWPKWSTMCQLRRLGFPVLNGVCVAPGDDAGLPGAVSRLAAATGANRLMVRSDGGSETRAYYRGGDSFSIDQVAEHATRLLVDHRAVLLLEPTNRFTNRLTVLLRMERDAPGEPGAFTLEALGPGFDAGDLTRGGIRPQVRISLPGVDWSRYTDPWWSDLRVSRDLSETAERQRRLDRLTRLATHIGGATAQDAERWLRNRGHTDLWTGIDPTRRLIHETPDWFAAAFRIAAAHHHRGWRCLATAASDLGQGRMVYWDVIDATHKFGTPGDAV
ncbi:hypothetical protein [Actinoplanes sp. NBRC 101535]|uniref:hypothetical protein n=1 Tax=Actinoplanes sp. NBRC 101535 TaxID=3032196 RepID=UPI0025564B25|nr:hypothetical protein [Actinoplanes sp. NBRC 101535]